jgi:hypothetical protein
VSKRRRAVQPPSPSGLGTVPVLLSPFRAWAAHVVQLGPVEAIEATPTAKSAARVVRWLRELGPVVSAMMPQRLRH